MAKSKFFNRYLPLGLSVLLIVVSVLTYLTFHSSTPAAQAAWYSSSWTSRKLMVIDHTKVSTASSTTLSNFPVLFSQTDNNLRTVANGGSVGNTDGSDILFTLGDGVTKLNHEIESYSSTTGTTIAWVKVPTLSPTVDTTLYIYYGNAGASNQQNAGGVWDSNYTGVYHLPNGTTLSGNDSTVNGRNGTLNGPPSATVGNIDGGATLNNSSNSITFPAATSPSTQLTVTAWVKQSSYGNWYNYVNNNWIGANGTWLLFSDASGAYYFGLYNGGQYDSGQLGACASPSLNVWHNLVGTYDGTSVKTYLDGQLCTNVLTTSTALYTGSSISDLGFSSTAYSIDEVTIAGTARSADWIVTQYNNQNSSSTFFKTYGTQQSYASQSVLWYNSAWSYRKPITIDHTKLSSMATSTYSSFPVLINVTDSDLKYTGSGGKVASSTGADILFTDSNGTSLLNYEIESYASTTGQLTAWVRIPTLSAASDYTIYEYFGNAAAPANSSGNSQGTWDSNYAGVWHLGNGNDSTLANNGTVHVATSTPGKIGNAFTFNGVSSGTYVDLGSSSTLNPATVTVSGWVNPADVSNTYNYIYSNDRDCCGSYKGFDFGIYQNKLNAQIWNSSSASMLSNTTIANNSGWVYGTFSYDGTTLKLYINGVLDKSSVNALGIGSPASYNGTIGGMGAGPSIYEMNGMIDEVRLSNTIRSADWIKTEYNNQSSPATFYIYGSLQSQNRAAATPAEGLTNRGAGTGWYNSAWSYRKPIVIDHTKVSGVASSTLNSFPVLISVIDSDLKYTGSGGHVASSTGGDILFTAGDGSTALNYEIESYASTTGQLIAWVKIPVLSAVTDTSIYEYFGNASAPAVSSATINGTWDTNYKAVQHFANGTTLSLIDSSSNSNNGSNGGTTAGTGKVDGAASFNGSSSGMTFSNSSNQLLPTSNQPFGVSLWVNTNNLTGLSQNAMAIMTNETYTVSGFRLAAGNCNTTCAFLFWSSESGGTFFTQSVTVPAINTWYYLSATYDGTAARLYVNGSLAAGSAGANTGTYIGNTNSLALAASNTFGKSAWSGLMDEMRVSNVARSADWIATEYNNQKNPSNFYLYGALGFNGRQSSAAVPTPAVKLRGGVKLR